MIFIYKNVVQMVCDNREKKYFISVICPGYPTSLEPKVDKWHGKHDWFPVVELSGGTQMSIHTKYTFSLLLCLYNLGYITFLHL